MKKLNGYIKIAVGGSKGKTTTLSIIEHALCNIFSDLKILSASTTEGLRLNSKFVKYVNHLNYFSATDSKGLCNIPHNIFISEATSFMISRGYYDSHKPDIAVFTGIEENEHLDIHGSFYKYLNAKKKLYDLLNKSNIAIINTDNRYWKYIISDCKAKIYSFGQSSLNNLYIKNYSIYENYSLFSFVLDGKTYQVRTLLQGAFNLENIAASILALYALGIDIKKIIKIIEKFTGVPGRIEKHLLNDNRIVIIDYAHTPNSLRAILELLKSTYKTSKIITIFGCGGDRTKEKRPIMGKIASELSDFVYLTTDNPRTENKDKIINDIISGICKNNYAKYIYRANAIKRAILDNKNSVFLIAGKGNEPYTEILKKYYYETKNNLKIRCDYEKPKTGYVKISDRDILYNLSNKYKLGNVQKLKNTRLIANKRYTLKTIYQNQIELAPNCSLISENSDLFYIKSLPSQLKLFRIDKEFMEILMKIISTKQNVGKVLKHLVCSTDEYRVCSYNLKTLLEINILIFK